MKATGDEVLGWIYARDGQKLMRPAVGDTTYQWPLTGEKVLPPHDDYLITLPAPHAGLPSWRPAGNTTTRAPCTRSATRSA